MLGSIQAASQPQLENFQKPSAIKGKRSAIKNAIKNPTPRIGFAGGAAIGGGVGAVASLAATGGFTGSSAGLSAFTGGIKAAAAVVASPFMAFGALGAFATANIARALPTAGINPQVKAAEIFFGALNLEVQDASAAEGVEDKKPAIRFENGKFVVTNPESKLATKTLYQTFGSISFGVGKTSVNLNRLVQKINNDLDKDTAEIKGTRDLNSALAQAGKTIKNQVQAAQVRKACTAAGAFLAAGAVLAVATKGVSLAVGLLAGAVAGLASIVGASKATSLIKNGIDNMVTHASETTSAIGYSRQIESLIKAQVSSLELDIENLDDSANRKLSFNGRANLADKTSVDSANTILDQIDKLKDLQKALEAEVVPPGTNIKFDDTTIKAENLNFSEVARKEVAEDLGKKIDSLQKDLGSVVTTLAENTTINTSKNQTNDEIERQIGSISKAVALFEKLPVNKPVDLFHRLVAEAEKGENTLKARQVELEGNEATRPGLIKRGVKNIVDAIKFKPSEAPRKAQEDEAAQSPAAEPAPQPPAAEPAPQPPAAEPAPQPPAVARPALPAAIPINVAVPEVKMGPNGEAQKLSATLG